MTVYRYDEWRVINEQRKYPFSDDAVLTNDELVIPNQLFLDARLYPIGGGPRQFISQIERANGIITFTIGDSTATRATASYSEVDIPDSGELAVFDTFGRPAGVLVSTQSALEAFSSTEVGVYAFTQVQTEFVATVVTPQPDFAVRGFILESGDVLTGDVWIVGEDGVVVRVDDDGALRFDAIGDPFAEQKLCREEETAEATLAPYCPVLTINGIAPDDYGNFVLMVGSNQSLTNVIRIEPRATSGDDLLSHVGEPGQLQTATLAIIALGDRRMRGAT